MVKERVWKHTRLDRNATEILDNVKEEMEADGISAPSYSEAIRKLKHDRDTAQQKQ